MIYISKNQYRQVEYLIGQSVQGNHVLFDMETVKKIFSNQKSGAFDGFSTEEAYETEPIIETLISLPSLSEKWAYLEQLDSTTFEKVVRTYFTIVENNILESAEVRH